MYLLFGSYLPCKKLWPFICINLKHLYQKMLWLKLVLRFSRWFSNVVNVLYLYRYSLILKRACVALHLNTFESPSTKDSSNFWLRIDYEEKILFISSMYLCYFVIIYIWARTWPFIWTHLNLLHLRMLCETFG